MRRLRALTGGLAVLLVAAMTFGVLAVQQSRRADTQRRFAVSRYLTTQAQALEQSQPDLALLLGLAAFQIKDTTEAGARLVQMANDRRDAQALLVGNAGTVTALAFSPTDKHMLVSAGADDGLVFWDVARRAKVRTVTATGVNRLAFSPDGGVLASGGSDIRLWDPRRRRALGEPLRAPKDDLLDLVFSPDGGVLAACGPSEIVLWDVHKRNVLSTVTKKYNGRGYTQNSCGVVFDSRGRRVTYAVGSKIMTCSIARREICRASAPVTGNARKTEEIYGFVPSPTGSVALVAANSGFPTLWDLRRDVPLMTFKDSREAAAFSLDGRRLAFSTADGSTVVDVDRRLPLRTFIGHGRGGIDSPVNSIALSPDGQMLASAGFDNTIAVFQLDMLGGLPTSASDPDDIAFSADGGQLVSASLENGIQTWDVPRRMPLGAPIRLGSQDLRERWILAFSPNGKLLAQTGGKRIVLWDVEQRIRLNRHFDHTTPVNSLAFSSDGSKLVSADGKQVVLWDVSNGKRISLLPGHAEFNSVAFSPDGRLVAVAAIGRGKSGAFVWDIARRTVTKTLVTGSANLGEPIFSPDGRWLALRTSDGIDLWDTQKWESADSPPLSYSAIFSPGGRLLAGTTGTEQPEHQSHYSSESGIWLAAHWLRLCAPVLMEALPFASAPTVSCS